MKENEASIDQNPTELNSVLSFSERVGAGVVNLLGAGISFDSIRRLIENLSDDSFRGTATAFGELVVGSTVIVVADQWKKRTWLREEKLKADNSSGSIVQ